FTGGVCERPAGTAYSLGDLTFSLVPDPYDTSHWRYSGSVTVTTPLTSVMVTIVLDSMTFAGAPVADFLDCTLVSPTGVTVPFSVHHDGSGAFDRSRWTGRSVSPAPRLDAGAQTLTCTLTIVDGGARSAETAVDAWLFLDGSP
ncbi:MAG: hypothetical protein AB7P00_05130, partial [Sandaracinaceae bacterium]